MTKRRAWIAALLVLLLAVAGGLAWLFTTDLGRFQPQLVAALGERLGRTVSVDPGLSIRLGRQIRIKASGLRVANAPWASHPDLLELASLDLSLDLYSLWRGPLVITSLEASGLRMWSERSADGSSNLDLAPPDAPARANTARPLPLMQHVALRDLKIEWQGRPADAPLDIVIESLSQQLQPDGMLALEANGAINGQPASYQGSLGSLQALLDGKDIHYHGKGQLGEVLFEAQGSLDDIAVPRYPEFDLRLSGSDFVPVARLLGRDAADEEPYRGAFSIHAVTQREDGSLQLQLEGKIGEMAIHAAGRCAAITDFSTADFQLRAAGPNLGAFSSLVGLGEWPRQAFQVEGGLSRQGALFVIDDTLLQVGDTRFEIQASLPRFPAWRGGTGRADISGPDVAAFRALLGFEGQAQGEFTVHLALSPDSGGGDRLEASAHTSLVDVTLSGSVGDGPGLQGSRIQGHAEGPDASQFLKTYGLPGYEGHPFALAADFEVREEGLVLAPGTALVLGDDRLELSGPVGFAPYDGSTELAFRTSGDDLAQFAPLLRQGTVLPGQPYTAEGELQLTQGAVLLHRLRGTVGPNQFEASGRIPLSNELQGTDLQFKASGPRLESLIATTPDFRVPAGDFEVSGRFDYQPDALRFDGLQARVGALQAQAALALKLPLSTASGPFDLRVTGPDPNALWPESLAFQPATVAFELSLTGRARAGVWTFEQAALNLGEARFTMSGSLEHLPDFSAAQLKLAGHAPDYARLGTFGGEGLPAGGLLDISAQFTGSRHRFRVDDLVLRIGGSDLEGSLSADFESAVPVFEWHSRSRLLNLAGPRGKPGGASKSRGRDSKLPFPDLAFPMERLARFNARMDLAADEVRLDQRHYTNVLLNAELRDGALNLSRLRAEGRRGFVDGTMSLSPRADGAADLVLALTAEGLVVHLSRDSSVDPETQPLVEYEVKLNGHGRGLHEAAATLDGYFHATASAGIIPNSVLSVLEVGLIEQVLTTVLPVSATETTTKLECLALRLEAERGLLRTAPLIALVTDRVQMVSTGTVNLADGGLDLTFENYPNKAYQTSVSELLVNPFVKISGTLAEPEMVLDAPKALVYSGIAIGTGGLSIIAKGLYDRVRHSSNPCEKFVEQARKGKK